MISVHYVKLLFVCVYVFYTIYKQGAGPTTIVASVCICVCLSARSPILFCMGIAAAQYSLEPRERLRVCSSWARDVIKFLKSKLLILQSRSFNPL
jgi:hypothetical protein